MFGSHKRTLTIVLTVVTLLAVLAPAALAAPEWLHGVVIVDPTTADPTYLGLYGYIFDADPDPDYDTRHKLPIDFTIEIAGTQVCNVVVNFYLVNGLGNDIYLGDVMYSYADLQDASNDFSEDLPVDLPDGWYGLKLVAYELRDERGTPIDWKCEQRWEAFQEKAVLIDTVEPSPVTLVKPNDQYGMYRGGTYVTGQDFLLVGTAADRYGIAETWFELCPKGSYACRWDLGWRPPPKGWPWPIPYWYPQEGQWIPIGADQPAVATPGIPGQWQTTWDSSMVPDGFYLLRFCAMDLAGNSNCWDERNANALAPLPGADFPPAWPDARWVYVDNRVEVDLQAGWNLVSSPLLLYDIDMNGDGVANIEDVLFHLIDHGTVDSVWSYFPEEPPADQWKVWKVGPGPLDTLTEIVDGQGYWIKMKANDTLTFVGTWTTLGNGATPPFYGVVDGWNLIGYTHWGRPTIWQTDKAGDYLSGVPMRQALFYYDPWTNVWVRIYDPQNMELGKGFWLSATEAGVIMF